MDELDGTKNNHTMINAAITLLRKMTKGKNKGDASLEVASETFGKGKHRAKLILSWVRDLITNEKLTESNKGKHRKTFSFIEDEDIQALCQAHLSSYSNAD
jgi:hypothetical protein